MSRDGNGNYSLPSTVNPVQDATQITTTWANTTLNDIATALTNSLVADGQKPMTAPLKFSDGLVSAPAITFNSENGSGWYRVSSGTLAEAIGGVQVATSTASTRTFKTAVVLSGSNSLTVGGDAAITGDATIGGTLDITGDVTFDGSLTGSGAALTSLNASNLSSGTVPSGRLTGTYAINVSGNAATATAATSATNSTNSTNVAITNDTSTNSTHYIHFGDATSGNDGVKTSSSKLTFNPSSGLVTATGFAGPLTGNVTGNLTGNVSGNLTGSVTGNVTGNVSGSSGSTTGNAATATKLATARTIDITGVTATGQSFDGSGNISIPITAVPSSLLTGTVSASRLSGTYNIDISGSATSAATATTASTANALNSGSSYSVSSLTASSTLTASVFASSNSYVDLNTNSGRAIRINGATTTGSSTGGMIPVANKPGSNANIVEWLPVIRAGGEQGYIPIWG